MQKSVSSLEIRWQLPRGCCWSVSGHIHNADVLPRFQDKCNLLSVPVRLCICKTYRQTGTSQVCCQKHISRHRNTEQAFWASVCLYIHIIITATTVATWTLAEWWVVRGSSTVRVVVTLVVMVIVGGIHLTCKLDESISNIRRGNGGLEFQVTRQCGLFTKD